MHCERGREGGSHHVRTLGGLRSSPPGTLLPAPGTARPPLVQQVPSWGCSARSAPAPASLCVHPPPATVSVLPIYPCSKMLCLCPRCAPLAAVPPSFPEYFLLMFSIALRGHLLARAYLGSASLSPSQSGPPSVSCNLHLNACTAGCGDGQSAGHSLSPSWTL